MKFYCESTQRKNPMTIGFGAYLMMIVFSVFYLYSADIWNIHISLFRIALLATIASAIFDLCLRRIRIYRTHVALYLFIFAAIILSGIDALRSQQNSLILKVIAGHILALGVLWVSVLQLNTESRIIKAVKWYVLSSAIAAAITIYTFISGQLPFPQFVVNLAGTDISLTTLSAKFLGVIPRAAAAFYDPTFYGVFLCICLCFAAFYKSWIKRNSLLDVLILVNVIMLVATLSRTAWIGAFVLAVLICIYMSQWRLYSVAIGMLVLAVIAGIVLSVGIFGTQDFGKAGDVTSLKSLVSREMYWNAGVSAFFAHPVSGGGSAELAGMTGGAPSAHIAYLSWLAKYGIIGFLVYCAFVLYPIAYALFKRSLQVRYRFLILGVMVPMDVMYFGYDFFSNLDIEYLAFGIVYAIILNRVGCKMGATSVGSAKSAPEYSLSS